MKHIVSLTMLAIIAFTSNAQFKVINSFKIASNGGWDYISVQPNSNRVFTSHGNQVNVLDKTTGDSLGFIPGTIGVHGIAFIPALNKGYTSNGRLNNVFVFDLKTLAVLDSIPTGKNPDAIFYDDFSKKLITCNGRSNDLSFIDPVTQKVVATVAVGGKPETAVSNGAGKVFVNIEDKNEIVAIDTKTFKVEGHWSLLPGESPTGLVIDNKTKRLFAACGDNNFLVILDAETGKLVDKLPIGKGCDGASFDPTLKNIYTSNGSDGTITVIHEDSKDKFSVIETIPTKKSARTMDIDVATHKLYLPASDTEPATGNGRPKMIPGTFQILVVGK
ncbi:YncE family protein [Parasediminibacterium paludis]|uniref:YncE family protein n=1 Tax=Parasediminibacterium paludis TaxID=908966 RepID=A0ABV8PY92_9BACT